MKIKPLKITFESLDDFAKRSQKALQDAVQGNKKSLQKKGVLIWASVESYQQFMSDQKYTILAVIYKYHPQSVYQLAKILNRAPQNVARDCDLLEGHGFIKFEQSDEGRKVKAPQLAFDYNTIMVCLPSVTYKVEFDDAA
jgi:predicted transcriptional regulator